MNLLQKYLFVTLDNFRSIKHNKGSKMVINNRLEAWLAFMCMDEPDDILSIIEKYSDFKEMYEQIYVICRDLDEVMGMFSKELQELDRNSVELMVDEMQKDLDKTREELEESKMEIEEKDQQLKENKLQLKKMQEELEHWKKCISKRINRQEYGRYNVSKIVNINSTSTKEEQLKDLITSIQQVKDSLVNILDEYEEDGEVDKADTLTEALDALEDAYDVV